MYKSDHPVSSSDSSSDAHERIPLALAIMTAALQGSPRSLELKTRLNECELLEKDQML